MTTSTHNRIINALLTGDVILVLVVLAIIVIAVFSQPGRNDTLRIRDEHIRSELITNLYNQRIMAYDVCIRADIGVPITQELITDCRNAAEQLVPIAIEQGSQK